MNTIPIPSILIEDRQRIDHSNTDGLRESLKTFGTIAPVLLEELSPSHPSYGDHRYRLVAGGRRLTFLKELGHTTLYHGSSYDPLRPGYIFGKELSKDEMHELELEENIRRKAMTWQEQALAIANLYRLKVMRSASEGKSWTQRAMGELLGVAVAKVNYTLAIAAELRNAASPLWKMDGPLEALRYFEEKKENAALAELAKRQAAVSQASPIAQFDLDSLLDLPDEEKDNARIQYFSNPLNDPAKFDEYWSEKQAYLNRPPKVYLSPRLFLGDALDFLSAHPDSFDHIVTDPPYAIDMDMLKQDNLGMSNIETVRHTHDVADNLKLLFNFFPLAHASLRDKGFLVLWCDYSVWQQLFSWAEAAGFSVQRWPLVWVKTHSCMNSAAQYNLTKTTEIAMFCRKGNATLCRPTPGHILAAHDEYKDKMTHPFVKPFAVWKHIIESISMEGQLILDPFAGHGTGPLSFLRLNRNFFACEKDEVHFNALQENLKQYYLNLDKRTEFV